MEKFEFENTDAHVQEEIVTEGSKEDEKVSSGKRGLGSTLRSMGLAAVATVAAAMPHNAKAEQSRVVEGGPNISGNIDTSKMSQTEWQQYQDKIFKETQEFLKKAEEDAQKMTKEILANPQAASSQDVINKLNPSHKELIQQIMSSAQKGDAIAKTMLEGALSSALELHLLDTMPRSAHIAITGAKREEMIKTTGQGVFSTDWEQQKRAVNIDQLKEYKEILEVK